MRTRKPYATLLLFASLACSGAYAVATEDAKPAPLPTAGEPAMDLNAVIALLQQQQEELAAQKTLLEKQTREIANLHDELDTIRAPAAVVADSDTRDTELTTQPLPAEQMVAKSNDEPFKTQAEKDTETGDSVATAQADDPTRALLTDFKGAWRLPGTTAALGIGGYVKSALVYNQDPLEIRDRFIVGSIPVGDDAASEAQAQSSITASQSRLNFDLREPTDVGLLRAFIEGDFASVNDTFRLRHAFGQWNRVLAGKTWSAFVDSEASPEEVDFEGLNGRINVRQSQVRVMPRLGEDYEFQLSLEDPNPQIQNGNGVTRVPDIVFSGRFQPHNRLHVKLGILGRQIRGQLSEDNGGSADKQYAWGVTLSGRFNTPLLDERDSMLFQLNGGNGIGRYVNDLSSVGDYDGIFNPNTGELELFDILAGYVSWQHWWAGTLRSNFTLGLVTVDNPGFVEDGAYKRTQRFSSNVIWTPHHRIDVGLEYLWGNRKNENGDNGDATQIQMSARYRF
jgi:hypothetical protein